jgi:hypothetical protein
MKKKLRNFVPLIEQPRVGVAVLTALLSRQVDIYLEQNKIFSLTSKNYALLMLLFYCFRNSIFTIGRHGYMIVREIKDT